LICFFVNVSTRSELSAISKRVQSGGRRQHTHRRRKRYGVS
jgi:hypothetical protein